jgi:putative aldouronate transport system permease protein
MPDIQARTAAGVQNGKGLRIQVSSIVIYAIVTLFSIACIIPFLIIISASFTEEQSIVTYGYRLWPRVFSTFAYNVIFTGSVSIFKSYLVTIAVTAAGTLASIILTLLLAYPLSRKRYRYRNAVNFYIFFTMLFNGGIVSWYILCTRYLGLRNSYAALIVPYLLNAWYVFLLRNFLATIPDSIEESATIDGAGNFRILFQIFVPLSLPGIATVGLFSTLMYWNDWWLALMLCDGNELVPLQLYLMRIIQSVEFLKNNINVTQIKFSTIPSESVRMAICVLATGPIIFAYPFFQRYFIKGLVIGSIKG